MVSQENLSTEQRMIQSLALKITNLEIKNSNLEINNQLLVEQLAEKEFQISELSKGGSDNETDH